MPMNNSTSTSTSSDDYSLHFSSHRQRGPLICPAALRKEGSSLARLRQNQNSTAANLTLDLGQTASATTGAQAYRRSNSSDAHHTEDNHHQQHILAPGLVLTPSEEDPPTLFSGAAQESRSNSRTRSRHHYAIPIIHADDPILSSGLLGGTNAPKGYLLPRSDWIPDEAVNECMNDDCKVTFGPAAGASSTTSASSSSADHIHRSSSSSGLFGGFTSILSINPFHSRRHHCRACGGIFCSTHSNNTVPLLVASRETIRQATSGMLTPSAGTHSPRLPPNAQQQQRPPTSGVRANSTTRITAASGGTRRSGSSTPAHTGLHESRSSYFPTSPSSNLSVSPDGSNTGNVITAAQVVNSRVCDICYLSLSLGANLYNPALHYDAADSLSHSTSPVSPHSDPRPSRFPGGGGGIKPAKSAPASASTSPHGSQVLSERVNPAARFKAGGESGDTSSSTGPSSRAGIELASAEGGSSAQDCSARSRQTSSSGGRSSHANSVDTSATTPPTLVGRPPPAETVAGTDDGEEQKEPPSVEADQNEPPASPTMTRSSSDRSVESSSSMSSTEARERADKVSQLRTAKQQQQQQQQQAAAKHRKSGQTRNSALHQHHTHPLDPRHRKISLEEHEETSSGSNPDASLEAVIPSTPANAWTWSTF